MKMGCLSRLLRVLKQAATRGNGDLGDDVTANVRTIRSIPLKIPTRPDGPLAPPLLVVRGEVLFLKKDFEAVNKRQAEQELPLVGRLSKNCRCTSTPGIRPAVR